ncbi:hypothetical protein Ancab_017967 [Ancistrocladus abbreviatus]
MRFRHARYDKQAVELLQKHMNSPTLCQLPPKQTTKLVPSCRHHPRMYHNHQKHHSNLTEKPKERGSHLLGPIPVLSKLAIKPSSSTEYDRREGYRKYAGKVG